MSNDWKFWHYLVAALDIALFVLVAFIIPAWVRAS